ncbi:flagellar biosynthetic protein FliO [Vibrio sp. SCSIO 43137]|uniref:flagellar biosynthetic protein FliO n=1 Tax=Vibrio sp. SCSIO 43137 TaxID=3021011 RepID=UPI0023074B5B|nr:flagellar biosynthetic protein FliO [Vibrio sp. SCSIO 43137]WCE28967.1 flagellar biosynthetic protein FliO [Vibrio sp. SCSIO 43137]
MAVPKAVATFLILLSRPVFAAGPPELDLLTTLGSLLFVIAVIFGLAWLMKRMRLPAMGSQKGLSVIRQIPVGTKERIAVVKAGEEQFLVGITPQSINLISRLDKPIEDEQTESGQFASQFSQILKKNVKE